MATLKVYLDDIREAPEGWVGTDNPDFIYLGLMNGTIKELSLDHDLGDEIDATGYDVLLWIEEKLFYKELPVENVPEKIYIHSANPVGRDKMEIAIKVIDQMVKYGKAKKENS